MNDAVALARIYTQLGDDTSAEKVLNKVKDILPTENESYMGSFLNTFKGELYLEKNDYKKVEETILEIDKLIQDMGFYMLKAKKERILAELHEKKGDWHNALEHYYASIDAPPD